MAKVTHTKEETKVHHDPKPSKEQQEENSVDTMVAKNGNVIRESSVQELMHQKNISRDEAIEIYRNA